MPRKGFITIKNSLKDGFDTENYTHPNYLIDSYIWFSSNEVSNEYRMPYFTIFVCPY